MGPLVSGYWGKTTSEGLAIPMTTKMTSATDNRQRTTDAKGVVRKLNNGYRLR